MFSKDDVANSYGLYVGQLNTTKGWSLAQKLQPSASPTIGNLRGANYGARFNSLAP